MIAGLLFSSYPQNRPDIQWSCQRKYQTMLCKSHRHESITTMFDYYAMPENTPNIDCNELDICMRMRTIEATINVDIGEPNCAFHFIRSEECLTFSSA